MELSQKIAIVTGAGRGIGEAVALALAKEGAKLAIVSRTRAELEKVASKISAMGGQAEIIVADVSKTEDVQKLIQHTLKTYGHIDILINAAGVYGPIGLTWETDAQQWIEAIQVNLIGTFLCCRETLKHMVARRQGKIINFSGGGATSPLPRFSAYGVSKTAVVRLTETLAEELRPFSIQVNSIAPGAVDTRLQDQVLAAGERAGDLYARIRKLRETGEGGVPRELAADLAVFLASSRAGNLTGKLISAPHDGWQMWDQRRLEGVARSSWFTLRRMDDFSVKPLLEKVK